MTTPYPLNQGALKTHADDAGTYPIKVMLLKGHTYSDAHQYVDDISTDEADGSGYARVTLTGVSWTTTDGTSRFNADNCQFATFTDTGMDALVVFADRGGDDESPLLFYKSLPSIDVTADVLDVAWTGGYVGEITDDPGVESVAGVAPDSTNDVPAADLATELAPYFVSDQAFLDEDDMASDSDEAVPSQQSVKAHVARYGPTVVATILVADADLSGGTATTFDLVNNEGTAFASGLSRSFFVGLNAAVYSGTDGGKIYTITSSGPCTLYRACNAGDTVAILNFRGMVQATNATPSPGAADRFMPIADARITTAQADITANKTANAVAAEHAFQTTIHADTSYFNMAAPSSAGSTDYAWTTPVPTTPSAGVWLRFTARPKTPVGYTPSDGDAFYSEFMTVPVDDGEGAFDVAEGALRFDYVAAQNRWRVTVFWEHTSTSSIRTVSDGATTASSTAFTSATAAFTEDDEGSYIIADGNWYTIDTYTSATEVQLSSAAASTASGLSTVIGVEDFRMLGKDASAPWYIPIDGTAEGAISIDFDNGSGAAVGKILRRVHVTDADEWDAQGRGWATAYTYTHPTTTNIASFSTYATTMYLGYQGPSMDLLEVELREENSSGAILANPSGAAAIAESAGGITAFDDTAGTPNTWTPDATSAQAIDPTA